MILHGFSIEHERASGITNQSQGVHGISPVLVSGHGVHHHKMQTRVGLNYCPTLSKFGHINGPLPCLMLSSRSQSYRLQASEVELEVRGVP
jgi:hypothetical protein